MPMPHQEMRRLIKRRIHGTFGTERIKALQDCLNLLPGYYTGPYGELRQWVLQEIDQAKLRKRSRHTETLAVPKQGDAQIVLLGPPNAGKSSLLRALSARQVAIGDYPFTTLRPIAATVVINHAYIQLVEIPGLIEGALQGRGGGRELLACARNSDGLIYLLPLEPDGLANLTVVMQESAGLIGEQRPLIVCSKRDLPGADEIYQLACCQLVDLPLLPISSSTGEGLEELRQAIWQMSGLMRVWPRQAGGTALQPFILPVGSTLEDFARTVHQQLATRMRKGKVWGPSARFAGQLVGREHVLQDGDQVEVLE